MGLLDGLLGVTSLFANGVQLPTRSKLNVIGGRVVDNSDTTDVSFFTFATGITASTTQTQGQGLLTADVNVITTCANSDDTVTLPVPETDRPSIVAIFNEGAQTLQVFPHVGGFIDGGLEDESAPVDPGGWRVLFAVSSTTWRTISETPAS